LLAFYPSLSPTEILTRLLSWCLRQGGEEASDLDNVVDNPQEQDLSVCPFASSLTITSSFLGSYIIVV